MSFKEFYKKYLLSAALSSAISLIVAILTVGGFGIVKTIKESHNPSIEESDTTDPEEE